MAVTPRFPRFETATVTDCEVLIGTTGKPSLDPTGAGAGVRSAVAGGGGGGDSWGDEHAPSEFAGVEKGIVAARNVDSRRKVAAQQGGVDIDHLGEEADVRPITHSKVDQPTVHVGGCVLVEWVGRQNGETGGGGTHSAPPRGRRDLEKLVGLEQVGWWVGGGEQRGEGVRFRLEILEGGQEDRA